MPYLTTSNARVSENPLNLSTSLAKTPSEPTIKKLLVIPFRKYLASHGVRMLRNSPERPTERKSESAGDGLTYGLTEVHARDVYASKKAQPRVLISHMKMGTLIIYIWKQGT